MARWHMSQHWYCGNYAINRCSIGRSVVYMVVFQPKGSPKQDIGNESTLEAAQKVAVKHAKSIGLDHRDLYSPANHI